MIDSAEAKITTGNLGEVQPRYSNFAVVSHSAHEFIISFCFLDPAKIKKGEPPSVDAEVFSRIVIAPTMLPNLINALATNLKTYNESVKKEMEKKS